MVNFDPASPVTNFAEHYLRMLIDSFPQFEDLIVDAELYPMNAQ